MLLRSLWLPLLLVGLLGAAPGGARPGAPAGALRPGPEREGDPAVAARLVVDVIAIAPGETFRTGVWFALEPGWHIYWRNPGESGLATQLSWNVPGASIGPIQWPAPSVFSELDGSSEARGGGSERSTVTSYGYSGSVLLYSEAVVRKDDSRVDLEVAVDFVACQVECIPGRISLHQTVPLEAKARPADPDTLALFDEWSARVPTRPEALGLSVEALYSQSAVRPGDTFRAAISLSCALDGPDAPCRSLRAVSERVDEYFAPDAQPSILWQVTGSRPQPLANGLLITLRGRATESAGERADTLRGVVQLRNVRDEWLGVEVDLPLPFAAAGSEIVATDDARLEPARASDPSESLPVWRALGLALLGGLILNLMPCVLPILAIKVFGIAERAHADRRNVLADGAAYTLGITATMTALAGLVIALRAAGTAVGWGFQFQEPLFVASISVLLVVFALNLFGVFEIALPASARLDVGAQTTGARRSFFEGLLAVLLATPCTAPFLGTAVGFAFASSAPVILGIFLAIGLGLAAPFVAITLVPAWASWIPRSGPWMTAMRAGLGFALLATVVWLLWVFGRSVGTDGMSLLLGLLVVLSVGVSIYGALQRRRDTSRAPLAAVLTTGLTAVALLALPFDSAPTPPSELRGLEFGEASPYDPAAVAAELATGRPVFVSFTADWCLTCKVNERVVLGDERVSNALTQRGFARFEADWTRRDEAIRTELARFGRAGVPMYLVYDPRHPDRPQVLSELLTVELFLDALRAIDT
jgi:thiol:disulfide interchange protein DsbD